MSSIFKSITDYANNALATSRGYLDKFKTESSASPEFITSNTLIAKFGFLILAIVLFIIFLNIGIFLLRYLMTPAANPYLIKGQIQGNKPIVIKQDISMKYSVQLQRSNNEDTGMEFTWSVWLNFNDIGNESKAEHIFNKGDNNIDKISGIAKVNNAPGLYVSRITDQVSNSLVLHVKMDTNSPNDTENTIDIPNIPIGKWVNVVIRLQNTFLDVYINGTIAKRNVLKFVPKQNYNDVNVCQQGGFQGMLSDLRYYNHAVNVFEINNIVSWGPNTSFYVPTTQMRKHTKIFDYLSQSWYKSQ
uniref:LamG-like jellyroll fold domain-containing protein n=1 Tax=viral metagenome TaxID=1070528 RepID=A0A6C0I3G2_9ZZZZ